MNFFNGSGHGLFESDQVDLQKKSSQVMGQPVLLRVKKIGFRSGIFQVGSENPDPFCHVSPHWLQMKVE